MSTVQVENITIDVINFYLNIDSNKTCFIANLTIMMTVIIIALDYYVILRLNRVNYKCLGNRIPINGSQHKEIENPRKIC